MARPSGPKTRCSGMWTEARYKSFIISALRGAMRRWAPKQEVLKDATTKRGYKRCTACGEEKPVTLKVGRKKVQNFHVDHTEPIVDPNVGFTTFDDWIERAFVEKDKLQVLCRDCHDAKCKEERQVAVERRRQEKLNG